MWTEAHHPQARLRLVSHATREFREDDAAAFNHPLARRMTPLQKSLVDAAYLLSREVPEAFRAAVTEGGCPIVFASAFGELGSNLGMLLALRRRELPLSPTSFQHSVHNCPVGYLSIAFKLRNPISTISAGFLSNEKALALGAATLAWQGRAGDRVLVLCADETDGTAGSDGSHGSEGTDGTQGNGVPTLLARAQALLLERVDAQDAGPGIYLERCAPCRSDRAPTGPHPQGDAPVIYDEGSLARRRSLSPGAPSEGAVLPGRVPAPLPFPGLAQARLVRSALGETLETRWISRD